MAETNGIWAEGKFVPFEFLAVGPIYQNATHKFFGYALPGTELTENKWRISRMSLTTNQIEWANGASTGFTNPYTDLATVEALTYS